MTANTAIVLLDRRFPRTADLLMQQLNANNHRGSTVEVHLFDGRDQRQAMQAALLERGIRARVRSAYKPLVHFFLEEIDRAGLSRVRIEYPRHPLAAQNRFLLEAYPLSELFPDIEIQFLPGAELPSPSHYRLDLTYADRVEEHRVFAPNVVQSDFLGSKVYTPSAWLSIVANDGGRPPPPLIDGPVVAEYQQAWQTLMQVAGEHAWGRTEPYFERLIVTMHLPGAEYELRYGDEHISTTEAMHEEVYFSLLEFFQSYSGRPPGDRSLQPGQIVPDIHLDNRGTPRVRVTIQPLAMPVGNAQQEDATPPALAGAPPTVPTAVEDTSVAKISNLADASMSVDLVEADRPLAADSVAAALAGIPGHRFAFRSRQGRAVAGVLHPGSLPAVVISGAQHANETSGVIGALRASQQLKEHPNAHFVLIPLENPDGYAMHQALCEANPGHMHHAARYTALGDDLEYRKGAPWYERQARDHAFEISQAQLHLNLHGYPAHEWTRPCTGYLPRGFELWSIPKGFFLILRYKPDYEEIATRLLEHVTLELAGNTRLVSFNERQLRAYQRYVPTSPFELRHGLPCLMAQAPGQGPGITLITEFPDETIYGDPFVFAHTVQMQTVVCATEWWWAHRYQGLPPDRPFDSLVGCERP